MEEISAAPLRTCVGCRQVAPLSDLVRLVVCAGSVVVDEKRVQPGRGAYLHRSSDCLAQALKKRALVRALRHQGEIEQDHLCQDSTFA